MVAHIQSTSANIINWTSHLLLLLKTNKKIKTNKQKTV